MTETDQSFRSILGTFATGVTVVTVPAEEPHGITVNAFSSVSLNPPLVLVCIDKDTKTYDYLTDATITSYCINVLGSDQQHLGEYFADMSDLEESPFETDDTKSAKSDSVIFTGALAYIDCDIWEVYPGGDHDIIVGEVIDAEILNPEKNALTFFKGAWGELETPSPLD
jgi:flavin reductase (DIM6/NTAB) family NADH-FMN oxidoreductase RutF